jgi:hypothetical protein
MTTAELTRPGFINVGEALVDRWPAALPQLPQGTLLDHIWAGALESDFEEDVVRASAQLLLEGELVLTIPGVDAIGIAIAASGGDTVLPVEVTILPDFSVSLQRIPIALRLKSDLLRPAKREPASSPDQPPRWVADASQPHLDIKLAEVTVTVDGEGDITFEVDGGIDLPPCMIGDSGVVVEAQDISLHFAGASPPPGQPAGWKGVHIGQATLHLPGELSATVGTLSLTDAYIGNGGFTGSVSSTWTPALSAELFGMAVTLSHAEIEFVQNTPVTFALSGTITLPFFDQPVGVDLEVGLDGSIGITVSAVQPAGATNAGGLLEFTKPGLLTMRLDSLGFRYDDGVFTALLSGQLTPLIGGLDWPGFQVQELSIDSNGNVRLEGGWLNLPGQYSLDFYGFTIAITRLGMGSTDDGGRWIGFSGSIKLVDGIGLGGSVDGLRIAWYPDGRMNITLDGVGVELEIPGTLRFKGSVSYHELPGPQHRFDGDITLELLAIGLRIDGKIVIGTDTNVATGETYTFFALFIGVELPAGIPLWATGLGLYGIAGLIAIQMAPNKGAPPNVLHPTSSPNEEWFENADGSPGWYKRAPIGITDLRSKWDPVQDGFALGGGVTIGTVADNGFTFSGSLLLVISFPGPVILLEGKANLLKERAALNDNPIFRALVVLDFRAGEFLVGLMAQYKFGDGGELIDIAGSAEAFFDFNDASRWHLYLGVKDPKERRIRAEILTLFEANSYFMLDARRLQMGAWVGYDEHWSFGPLKVTLEAWLEGGVVLSWKPVYFHGELWLHGKAELSVFGFGLGLSVDARFSADVFDPFHLLAEFSVGISLPWPLPDFDVDITLEWGPTPEVPPLPLPLKEIAVEHFKSTASWPLPRASLLLPNADAGEGYLIEPPPAAPLAAGPPGGVPVVPMDARPHITFGRAVHDDALIGVNPQPVLPTAVPPGWERVGDPEANQGPMRVRFSLQEVVLAKWNGASWADVARKGATPNAPGLKELYGSWAPIPQLPSGVVTPGTDPPVAQVKLWLWSKTPFDYSRHGGRAWDEWFTDEFDTYPCIPPVPERTVCCDVDGLPVGTVVTLPHPCRRHPEVLFVGTSAVVTEVSPPQHGHSHALCFEARGRTDTVVALPGAVFGVLLTGDPARKMRLVFVAQEGRPERHCVEFDRLEGRVVELPYTEAGSEFRVFGPQGEESSTRVVSAGSERGIDIRQRVEVKLDCSATRVDIVLLQQASPVKVAALDDNGDVVDTAEGPDQQGVVQLQLTGSGIVLVVIEAPQDEATLLQLCYECAGPPALQVEAIGVDVDGNQHGPFYPVGDTITVEVDKLRGVLVRGKPPVCLLEVCVTFPPDGDAVAAAEDMQQRLVDAMALWGGVGEVLEANTDYRVRVVTKVEGVGEGALAGTNKTHEVTELSYFRTEGPPALVTLSTPVHHPPAEAFDSGLDDLTRYVAQTVPPTVPAQGEQALLPRPVYRAYDVGAVFNEDYVDLMYRLARRDLLLYLYDSNNQPVRDAAGRLIVSTNRWGVTESLTLSESTVRYISVLDQSECVLADPTIIPHQVTLFAADPGLVLEPDIVHQARLTPLLLHEDFSDGLSGWTVVDQGANQGPSAWAALGHPKLEGTAATVSATTVTLTGAGDLSALDPAVDVVILSTDTARPSKTYRVLTVDNAQKKVTVDGNPALFGGSSVWTVPGWGAVRQTSNIWGGVDDETSVPRPGTMLAGGDVAWTDYRYTVQLRSGDDDAIGVVFRYQDANNYYRFSMDRERRYRRLVRVGAGVAALLAADDFVFSTNQDYVITVEAIGASLRVYQDGALVFDASDPGFPSGKVGFYCWANQDARFNDVRVDDFRPGAPVAYRFSFTTSAYANFFHHLHSYQDETWVTEADDGDLSAEIAAAVAPGTALRDAETRAFTAFVGKVLGQAAQKAPASVELHRVTVGGETVALLLRSPEPIDWTRTSLELLRADGTGEAPAVPGVLKLTDLSTGGTTANEETVKLLARTRTNPAGAEVEALTIPGPLLDAPAGSLLDDDFSGTGGLLFAETFSANALDTYRIFDAPGSITGPSAWSVSAGAIRQTSNVYSGSVDAAEVTKIGTVAVTGPRVANLRLTAVMRSTDDDAIGVVFRYDDDANWYRLSMDRERAYRRLVKSVAGVVTVLWEDHAVYNQGQAYELRIDAYGDLLLGYLDKALLFAVRDADVKDGQAGLYCWANVGAAFEALSVEALEASPLLFQAPLQAVAELTRIDSGDTGGPGAWAVAAGEVTQTSSIHGETTPPGPLQQGTIALLERSFGDLELSIRLASSEPGAIGALFRYIDSANWYRFSMEATTPYRRLVKCEGGVVSVLWQDSAAFSLSTDHQLTLLADGRRLAGWLDGEQLFDITDAGPAAGRIGFYCRDNGGASFSQVVVADPVRRIGRWQVIDEPAILGSSVWQMSGGALKQTSNTIASLPPEALATMAVSGEAWDDYRIVCRMRSDDDDGIGLVFRYVDQRNYYRLSLDAERSFRRLVKLVDGVTTVLWEDANSYTVGTAFTLTVDVTGDRIVAYQGADRLFDVNDSAHAAGRVGLYSWLNTGARFERITVTRPPLEAYARFRDSFGAGDLSAWTIVDDGDQSTPSAWAIDNGTLRQTSNIYSLPLDPADVAKRGTLALAGDPSWTDYALTATLKATDDDAFGLVFRYQDGSNFYRFSMDRERTYRRVVKCAAGVFSTLWEDATAYDLERPYELTIACEGDSLRGWLDGVPVFEVEDSEVAAGQVGLYCWGHADCRFSNVRVFETDRLQRTFLAEDDFAFETAGLWSYATAGDQDGPAAWETTGGELRQTSNVWGGDPAGVEPALPGTLALAGDATWTDYRVSVRLASDDDDAIGVVLRYQDADNWYRFSMDSERGYRRLVKSVAGVVTELWSDIFAYEVGREYLVTIDVLGAGIAGFLDGVPMFTVRDSDVATGGIGLYCWANTDARFQSVRVTATGWTAHYRFGPDEETVAAGTRIAIHSGNAADWTDAPKPGLSHRFIAGAQESGRRRLPANLPVPLRVRDGMGAPGHARRFLPVSEYAPLADAKLLRRADGLDVAIFLPAATPLGSLFDEGQYRLALVYMRDNTSADPNSVVVSQAGDTSAEEVTLDIPWAGVT